MSSSWRKVAYLTIEKSELFSYMVGSFGAKEPHMEENIYNRTGRDNLSVFLFIYAFVAKSEDIIRLLQ